MRKILRSLAKILARISSRLRSGVGWCAGFADGLVAGLLGGGGYDDAEDEVVEIANDNEAREAISQPKAAPAPCLGLLAKRAGECRDANRAFASLFDLRDPDHRRVHDFVAALDASGLRALRSMPQSTVARHLDRGDPLRAVGFPDVDQAIARAKAADLEKKPAAKRSAKEVTAELIRQAAAAGRQADLGEVLAANRRG